MRTRSKLAIAALAAIAMLGLAVGAATASKLSFSNGERGFRLVWTPLTFEAGGRTMRCNVTLEGSFTARSIVKEPGETIGRVTRAEVATCSGGTMRANTETLPWNSTYRSFSGALPEITGVTFDFVNATFTVHPEGLPSCVARTEVREPVRGIASVNESGEVPLLRVEENSTIGTAGGFLCEFGTRGRFIGTASATVLGETAHTRIVLIEGATPSVEPSPVDFGTVEPESTTRRTMTIESGEGTTVESISVRNGTNFSITDPNSCRGRRLAARTRCSFTAIFDAPATEGRTYEDTVIVATSARRIEVAARGRTSGPFPPTAEPEPVAFGRLATGTLARRTVSITAVSEVTLNSISMREGFYFAIVDPNRCVGRRLAREARCSFNVLVEAPEEAGRALSDTVLIGNSIRQIEDSVTAET